MQTMADRDGLIWFDGEMVDWREAKIHVLTHTLHYGMGVFEGLRAYEAEKGTAIFRLQAHTDRLFESAEIMNMDIPFDKDTLNEAQLAAVRENNLESAYVRPMCFYGSEGMGLRADNLKVHVMVAAWEWGAYLGQEALENGIVDQVVPLEKLEETAIQVAQDLSKRSIRSLVGIKRLINYSMKDIQDYLDFESFGQNTLL